MEKRCTLYFALEKMGFKSPSVMVWDLVHSGNFLHGCSVTKQQFGGGDIKTIMYGKYKFYYWKDSTYHLYAYGEGE